MKEAIKHKIGFVLDGIPSNVDIDQLTKDLTYELMARNLYSNISFESTSFLLTKRLYGSVETVEPKVSDGKSPVDWGILNDDISDALCANLKESERISFEIISAI